MDGQENIIECERLRLDAMVRGDVSYLERILDDELEYFNGDGRYHDKAKFLADMRSGNIKFRSISMRDEQAWLLGDVGLACHKMTMNVHGFGKDVVACRAVTAVWRLQNGEWRLRVYRGFEIPVVE